MASKDTHKQAGTTESEVEDHKQVALIETSLGAPKMPSLADWVMIATLTVAIMVSSLFSTSFEPALTYVMEDFKSTSGSLQTFTISAYILGYVFGPLIISPLSEIYGRFWPLHLGSGLFVVCLIACSFSTNIGMFLFFRVLLGFAGVALVILGPAVVADLVPKEKRGFALSSMMIGPCVGPTLGPLIGGYVVEQLAWRWIFWIATIAMVVCWVPAVFVLRETYPPVLEAKAARKEQQQADHNDGASGLTDEKTVGLNAPDTEQQSAVTMPTAETISPKEIMKRAWIRPLKMLFRSPIVMLVAIYTALYNAYLQIYFATIGTVFQEHYSFSTGQSGLAYLGQTLGFLISQLALIKWADQFQRRMEERHGGEERPEFRLLLLAIGAVAMPFGICLYAWTVQAHIHWIVPVIGTAFIAVGVLWGYLPCLFYLVDVYPLYAASAVGGATIVRSAVSAVLPLAADPIFNRLGFGWGNTLLAFLTVAFIPLGVYLYMYGEGLRKKSRYDPSL